MLDTVLIIDDDPIHCEIVRTALEREGAKNTIIAMDGRSASKIVASGEETIDFIVLDLKMPDFDGIEFLNEIKNLSFTGAIAIVSSEIPVIIKMAEDIGTQHGLNIIDTVKKPLTARDIKRWKSELAG